jgi:hypothetical protein
MERARENIVRQMALLFLVVVAGYAVFFAGDQYIRTRKGPWEVQFRTTNNEPRIIISQSVLGISNVVIAFSGESVSNSEPATVRFDRPLKPIPFGKKKFEDLTYLPGSVAFDFFGHEVELLPRTLYINKVERGWNSWTEIRLQPSEKLPPEKFYDPRKKKRR